MKYTRMPLVSRRSATVAGDTTGPAPANFTSAMSLAVTGVNIVTTNGPAGRYGLTVSAVSSVSAEPPMVLICVNRKSVACRAIEENGCFAINVLSVRQQPLAETFSGSNTHGPAYSFREDDWSTAVTPSPVLKKALATFDCHIEAGIPVGTHTIFTGRVLMTRECPGTALLYTSRSYGRPLRNGGNRHVRWFSATKNVLGQLRA